MTTTALHDEVLREIAARGNVRRWPAHTVLIHEGDDSETLFIVLEGRVRVTVANADGKEVILGSHGPGEFFGELALDGGARSATVTTEEPTRCAVVGGAELRDFVAAHPDFAVHLLHHLIRRVRTLTGSVKSLALDDVYSRVVALLTQLSEPQGAERVIARKLTQQDIAEHVGSSREMVSRIFKELVAGGYLRVDAGRIRILKPPPRRW